MFSNTMGITRILIGLAFYIFEMSFSIIAVEHTSLESSSETSGQADALYVAVSMEVDVVATGERGGAVMVLRTLSRFRVWHKACLDVSSSNFHPPDLHHRACYCNDCVWNWTLVMGLLQSNASIHGKSDMSLYILLIDWRAAQTPPTQTGHVATNTIYSRIGYLRHSMTR